MHAQLNKNNKKHLFYYYLLLYIHFKFMKIILHSTYTYRIFIIISIGRRSTLIVVMLCAHKYFAK